MHLPPVGKDSQPIKNWAHDPSFFTDNVSTVGVSGEGGFGTLGPPASYTRSHSTTDVPSPGIYRSRTDTLTADGGYGRRWNHYTGIPIKMGDVIRISFWFKASFGAIANPYLEFANSGAAYSGGVGSGQNITVTPNVWTRFTYTYSPINNNHFYLRSVGSYVTGATALAGSQISYAGLFITINQPLPEVYCDATTPGWKWTGAVGQSPSVGWPYTLESIAGPPLLSVTSDTPAVEALGIDAFQGRTLYTVFDMYNLDASYGTISRLGGTNTTDGRMNIQTGATGSSSMAPRWDTLNGTNNRTSSHPNRRTIGRHVGVMSVNDGMTIGYARFDNGAYLESNTITPGEGMPEFKLRGVTSTDRSNIISIAYPNWHDATTVNKILHWLANKYGVPMQ